MSIDEKRIEEFLSKARHDLRNPINAILGYTELLLEECGESEALRKDLEKIQGAAKELLERTNQLKLP